MDDDGAPYKKRRLQNACDECRKRKIKCDSANMPGNICSRCVAFGTECTHVMAMAKKKRGPPRGVPRGQATVQAIVRAILSTTKTYEIPDDPEDVRQVLIDLAQRIVSLEEQLQDAKRAPSTSATSPESMSSASSPPPPPPRPSSAQHSMALGEPDAPVKELAVSFVKQLRLGHSQPRYKGSEPGGIDLLLGALEEKRELVKGDRSIARREEYWKVYPWQIRQEDPDPKYTFPEDDLMWHLFDMYFTEINIFYPVLHRGIFEKGVKAGLHHRDRYFAAVVLAVCATGSRLSNDPRVLEEGSSSRLSAGWKWFMQIRLVRGGFMMPPSLYELQLYCIAIFFVQDTSTPETCWILLGLGVRFAQDLGVHRKPATDKPTVESQLWNRAFWVLIACDVVMSAFLGRPRATQTDDFDLPLPIECDDEYWETEDPEQAFKQPAGKPCTMSHWVLFLKLMDIIGFAQRTIYAVRKTDMSTRMGMTGPEWNEKIVAELDSALNAWVDLIPNHLKWHPNKTDKPFAVQSTVLHVTYYWVQILVHKPFLEPTDERTVLSFPSLSICANAARSVVHLLEGQPGTRAILFPTVLNGIYTSAIVLFLNAWRGKRLKTTPDTSRELGDVYKCLEILRGHEPVSQVAGRFFDILKELLQLFNLPTDQTSPLKRTRPQEDDGGGDDLSMEADGSSPYNAPPRPMAGSKRVSQMQSQSETSQHPHPHQHQHQHQQEFSLPISSAELGSLPLHESFTFTFNNPSASTSASAHPHPADVDLFAQFAGPPTFDASVMNPGSSSTPSWQDSSYTSRFMAESLSTAFGNIGPDVSFASFGAEAQTQAGGTSYPVAHPAHGLGSWTDWDTYMAGIDEALLSQNFASFT